MEVYTLDSAVGFIGKQMVLQRKQGSGSWKDFFTVKAKIYSVELYSAAVLQFLFPEMLHLGAAWGPHIGLLAMIAANSFTY